MFGHFRRRLLAAAGALSVLSLSQAVAAVPQITASVNENELTALRSNMVPEAIPQNDRGRVADDLRIEDMILLLHRTDAQEADLKAFLHDQLDRNSTRYHKWLSAKEFGKRFGIARSDADAITSWLRAHGFSVNAVPAGAHVIGFSGTAGQVREAFHTEIHALADGKHYANMSIPQMPSALARAVVGLVKLNNFMPHKNLIPRTDFTYTNGSKTYHAIVPEDLATIYNLNPVFSSGNTGQGQTVVVIEDSDVAHTSDWTTFRAKFGLSQYTQGSFTQVHPTGSVGCTDPGVSGAEDEANLDAQWASAGAPSAAIVLASCRDTSQFGGFLALQNLVNGDSIPPVVSISYGTGEEGDGQAENQYISDLYQQASAEGISVFVSSGDEGSAENDHRGANPTHGISISGWMSTPYNVSVGGTDFADTYLGTSKKYWKAKNTSNYGSAKSYMPEFPWDDSCANVPLSTSKGFATPYGADGYCNNGGPHSSVAGSGGPSNCATGQGTGGLVNGTCAGWPKPEWQTLVGVPKDGVRDTPDVSLMAANGLWGHYFVFCDTDGGACGDDPADWPGAGGTSFSSPIWAGFMALIVNKKGEAQGLPNPVLYSLANEEYGRRGSKACSSDAKHPGASCVFYDVTLGDNDVNCNGTVDCYVPSGASGVLSTSNSAYQPAFATGKGYDFATGIGTVNVSNLVNAWP